MPNHRYKKFDIEPDDEFITKYAEKYISIRAQLNIDPSSFANNSIFNDTGFDTNQIKDIIQKYVAPNRVTSQGPHRDIYRSDLGELLMIHYFEIGVTKTDELSGIDKVPFTVPIKNLFDRELNDLPGRGFDLIGYRLEPKLTLLLGEAKISGEKKNPPQVVHGSKDSIFKSQKRNREDRKYILERLTNYYRKLQASDAVYFSIIILSLEQRMEENFNTVYACCLVRDYKCVKENFDFGKMQTEHTIFEPGQIHFVIPSFLDTLENVVNKFEKKVRTLSGLDV